MIRIDDSVIPSVAKNIPQHLEELETTTKDIFKFNCASGWNDNKVGVNICPCLRLSQTLYVLVDDVIRKVTPEERMLFMGFSRDDYSKLKGISTNQIARHTGNSVVVAVVEEIFNELF